jgi:hypothetical protein
LLVGVGYYISTCLWVWVIIWAIVVVVGYYMSTCLRVWVIIRVLAHIITNTHQQVFI